MFLSQKDLASRTALKKMRLYHRCFLKSSLISMRLILSLIKEKTSFIAQSIISMRSIGWLYCLEGILRVTMKTNSGLALFSESLRYGLPRPIPELLFTLIVS